MSSDGKWKECRVASRGKFVESLLSSILEHPAELLQMTAGRDAAHKGSGGHRRGWRADLNVNFEVKFKFKIT